MTHVNYQTVRLQRGRHESPADGVCVMELASMLAGEPFSDQPRSVSPAIGSFLRAYNDRVDDPRRDDLYAYAARVVGTAAPPAVESARLQRLIAWGDSQWEGHGARPLRRLRQRLVNRYRSRDVVNAGIYAVESVDRIDDRSHAEVLAFIGELLMIGCRSHSTADALLACGPFLEDSPSRTAPLPARV